MSYSNYYGNFQHPWPQHYKNRQHMHRDAALREAFRSLVPIMWSEVALRHQHDPEASKVFAEAAARPFELNEGMVVPIRDPEGRIAIFTIAGTDFAPEAMERCVLSDYARRVHSRALELEVQADTIQTDILTRREVEVLNLMKERRSDWEIGQLLGMAETTAKTHRANIRKKLNVSTSGEAVFAGFTQGLIEKP